MKLSNAGSPGKQGYDQRLGDKVPTPVHGFGCAFTGQVLGDSHPLKALGGTSMGLATVEAMTGSAVIFKEPARGGVSAEERSTFRGHHHGSATSSHAGGAVTCRGCVTCVM